MSKQTFPTQTFVAVWFHDEKLLEKHNKSMISGLDQIFHYVRVFIKMEEFLRYVDEDRLAGKLVGIISHMEDHSSLFKLSKKREQFLGVYVFLSKNVASTGGVFTNPEGLLERIRHDLISHLEKMMPPESIGNIDDDQTNELRDVNSLPIESLDVTEYSSQPKQRTYIRHLDKKSPQSLMLLSAIRILLSMNHDEKAVKEMLMICRDLNKENCAQLDHVDNLKNYDRNKVIEYYTRPTFLYKTVNGVLRTEDIKEIFPFRVYITDLHNALRELNLQNMNRSSLVVYRGKRLTPSALQSLIDNKNGLVTFNGFLSTSANEDVAQLFAGAGQGGKDCQGVLFQFNISKTMIVPHADVSKKSQCPGEEEVLVSLGAVWRIQSTERDGKYRKIVLESCDEMNATLDALHEKYTSMGCTLLSLGDILQDLGDNNRAELIYHEMLEQDSLTAEIRSMLYWKIGLIQKAEKNYHSALENLKKAAELLPVTMSEPTEFMVPKPHYIYSNQTYLVSIHSNQGFSYEKLRKISRALDCYKQALAARRPTSEDWEIAAVHNDIGRLLFLEGEYYQSCEHFNQAVALVNDNHARANEYKKNLTIAKKRCDTLKKTGKS